MMGVGLVHYTAGDGTLRTIRQAFASAAAVDPFARVAAGRSAFRVLDLLAVAALLDSLDGDGGAGRAIAGRGLSRSCRVCKIILRISGNCNTLKWPERRRGLIIMLGISARLLLYRGRRDLIRWRVCA